jgi:hypothetical protein
MSLRPFFLIDCGGDEQAAAKRTVLQYLQILQVTVYMYRSVPYRHGTVLYGNPEWNPVIRNDRTTVGSTVPYPVLEDFLGNSGKSYRMFLSYYIWN